MDKLGPELATVHLNGPFLILIKSTLLEDLDQSGDVFLTKASHFIRRRIFLKVAFSTLHKLL